MVPLQPHDLSGLFLESWARHSDLVSVFPYRRDMS